MNVFLDNINRLKLMNSRAKAALVVTALNSVLTVLKFIAYSATCSVAVLADAWHSFADIATSALVFLSIVWVARTVGLSKHSDHSEGSKDNDISPRSESMFEKDMRGAPTSRSTIARFFGLFSRDMKIAFGIGLFLVTVSVLIFMKAARPSMMINSSNLLVTGIMFLLFSFCSYGIYRYETRIGQLENSMGLIADGMHSKADMIASLLTGLSLLLYTVGVNVDRFVALLIGLFIFSIASELIVNSVVSPWKKDSQLIQYRFPVILASILKPTTWKTMANALDAKFNLGWPGFQIMIKMARCAFWGVVLVGVWILAMNCVYVVGPAQEAIVKRFGRSLHYGRSVPPGLHLKLPWPIDKVIKVDSKTVRTVSIGIIEGENIYALLWTREHAHEAPFLSADNSFFYPYAVVNYTVKDVFKYIYRHQFPDELIKNVANRTISGIFVTKPFYEIATTYRKQLEIDIACLLQAELNRLGCGVDIVDVYLKDIHPPTPIAPSFEKVIAAFQEKQQIINDAQGYQNSAIPSARGDAVRQKDEAVAYSIEKRQNAMGQTARFLSRLAAYQDEKSITRKRLYLDAMKDALTQNRKILLDPSAGAPELWIGFEELFGMSAFEEQHY